MNKACRLRNHLFSLIFFACLILFNLLFVSGCGLDTYYVINPPDTVIHEPIYSSIDTGSQYFEFYTKEATYNGIRFLGTDVYYKIYGSSSQMETEYRNIITTANNAETAVNAPSRLIDTYKYKTLETSASFGSQVFIPATGSDRLVKIRLSDSDATDNPTYAAEVLVDGALPGGASSTVIPYRNITTVGGAAPTFSFARLAGSSPDLLPKNDDADVNYNSANGNDFYVCMFAIAVAQDMTYAQLYSNVLYLGSVKISIVP